MPSVDLPIACTLTPAEGTPRMTRWRRLNERAHARPAVVDDRLEVAYDPAPGVAAELAELVADERSCCAFADWTIESRDGRPVLIVSAPPGSDGGADGVRSIAVLFGA